MVSVGEIILVGTIYVGVVVIKEGASGDLVHRSSGWIFVLNLIGSILMVTNFSLT